jgi:CheY-like chemotaxis protein
MPRVWIDSCRRVVLVQRDPQVRRLLTSALEATGHVVVALPCGTWLAPLLRDRPLPDAVVLDHGARGYDYALDVLDDLDVEVPVVATRFDASSRWEPPSGEETARQLIRDIEKATRRA